LRDCFFWDKYILRPLGHNEEQEDAPAPDSIAIVQVCQIQNYTRNDKAKGCGAG